MPMILMTRVQDVAKIRQDVRADQGRAVHHRSDILQTFGDFDIVDDRIDGWERTDHFLDGQTDLERLVVLWIKVIRRRHASRHPNEDTGVSRWFGMLDCVTFRRIQ